MTLKHVLMAVLMTTTVVAWNTDAYAGGCDKQGSSQSIAWIQAKYKNCVNCGVQKGKDGKMVYYCYCGSGCKTTAKTTTTAQTTQNAKKDSRNTKDNAIKYGTKAANIATGGAISEAKKAVKTVKKVAKKVKKIF